MGILTTSRARDGIKWIWNKGQLIAKFSIILAAILFIVFSIKYEIFTDRIDIEAIVVPEGLAKNLPGGKVLSTRIADEMMVIAKRNSDGFQQKYIQLKWDRPIPDIKVGGYFIPVKEVVAYLSRIFGGEPYFKAVSGDIFLEPKCDNMKLALRVNGRLAGVIDIDASVANDESKLYLIAMKLWQQIDRSVAAWELLEYSDKRSTRELFFETTAAMLSSQDENETAMAQLFLAMYYSRTGDVEAAMQKMEQLDVIKIYPPLYKLCRGNAYYDLEMYDEAIQEYKWASYEQPYNSYVFNNWGNALYAKQQYDDAIIKYQQALKANPKNAVAYAGWGDALSLQGKKCEAIDNYRLAIEANPRNNFAYNGWGNALFSLFMYKEAIEQYDKAIEIKEDWDFPYSGKGDAYVGLGEYCTAIETVRFSVYESSAFLVPLFSFSRPVAGHQT